VLLGDELDSPRGRIYLIKEMLEAGRAADPRTVLHLDRCLSCLACMTTCPSGVHYMHLVDHARAHVEDTHRRPFLDRALRRVLGLVLPRPPLFRLALAAAALAKPLARFLPARLAAMLALAPARPPAPSPVDVPQIFPAIGATRLRVALLAGCANPALAPRLNEATVRLLTRLGCEVAIAPGAGCCGALNHHLGQAGPAHRLAQANIAAWLRLWNGLGPDAIVVNASGCGTTVKDYGFMFRADKLWAAPAARVSALARDVSEVVERLGLGAARSPERLRVAHHSACSLQHGQRITREPGRLLAAAGFEVVEPAEPHLCCGSAGTYNMLQPELAGRLRERKVANLERTRPDAITAGNLGCIAQIGAGTAIPIVHTVELLDWATGGPKPAPLLAR
jgi:glycolate oxidase iron-sulfur subunit